MITSADGADFQDLGNGEEDPVVQVVPTPHEKNTEVR